MMALIDPENVELQRNLARAAEGWQPQESTAEFYQIRWLHHGWANGVDAARDAIAKLQTQGCTFFRASVAPKIGRILVEGWTQMPDEQGEVPLL
jgi:hypothetical protein